MVALTTMYDGQANSPAAELVATLLVGGTSCTVDDDSILPSAPMKLVIGADAGSAETVLMTNKPGSNVLTITRAQEGTTAREWPAGTKVQRVFTAGDLNVLIDNVEALNTGKQELTNSLTAETALANADVVPFYDDSASAHRKSTWSNIKSVLKTYFDTLYNNYSHPTGDGNSHVPANSTTNNGKVLTASDTAGTYTWESIPADANKVDKVITGSKVQLYGVNASNTQTMYELGAASSVASLDSDTRLNAAQVAIKDVSVTSNTTLGTAHNNRRLLCSNSSAINLTIDTQASGSYAADHETVIKSIGAGQVTIVLTSGVSVKAIDATKLKVVKGGSVVLKKNTNNEWSLDGAVE